MIGAISKELVMQSMIQDLLLLGVTDGADGTDLHQMNYYELRHLLTLERLKSNSDVNIEHSENEWF